MESKISEANAHIIIFGWCENILMGISLVNSSINILIIRTYVWNSQIDLHRLLLT